MNHFSETICIYGHNIIKKYDTINTKIGEIENEDIITKIINYLFKYIYQSDEKFIYEIQLSIVEICKDKIRDLLTFHTQPISKGKELSIDNPNEIYVSNEKEIFKLIQEGNKRRFDNDNTFEEQNEFNKSNIVIKMKIQKINLDTLEKTNGKLYFINSTDGNNVKQVNDFFYNIFKTNSNVNLIIACDPRHSNDNEMLSTLFFGNQIYLNKNKLENELLNLEQRLYNKEIELNNIKENSLFLKEKEKLLEDQINNIANNNTFNSGISLPIQETSLKINIHAKPSMTLVKEKQLNNDEQLKLLMQNKSTCSKTPTMNEHISNNIHKLNNLNNLLINDMSNNELKQYIYSLLQENEILKNENKNITNLYTNIKNNFDLLQKENDIYKSTINTTNQQTILSSNSYSSFPKRKIIQGGSSNNLIHHKLISMKQMTEPLLSLISKSISLIEKKSHYYLSFNGGKDCLAAYIILKYYLYCEYTHKDYTQLQTYNDFINNHTSFTCENKVTFLYFIGEKYFECEQDYVISFAKRENIKIIYCYSSYVKGLNFIIKKYNIDYIIMGTRKSDIKTPEEAERISKILLHESTKPFPHFMRYYPVFLLSYSDIWMLILSADFPYLNLYDKGYSSIGHKDNTKVNINLYNKIDNTYYPAWYLQNEESERKFR